MRLPLINATVLAVLLATVSAPAIAETKEVTVWAWDVAADALESTLEGFNKLSPDIQVKVEDLGVGPVFDRALSGCAAGGEGLPDVVLIENFRAELFWNRFPECFANLKDLGYSSEIQEKFPAFKRVELEVGDVAYAMPWDSGPAVVFYRRDFYEKAGVDPASIQTWDDFIAAGQKISAANPGVVMSQADFNGDSEWFQMMAAEQGCGYFSGDGQSISINQPGCVSSLEKLKLMKDSGTLKAGNWDEKIQANNAGTVASQLYGAWYEGTIRSTSPELSGKWGVHLMPSFTADGSHAANVGGSALAISATSQSKESAWTFISYALGTNEGQVAMLKSSGIVPSLLSALEDPFVSEPQPYWGGQKVWSDILPTLSKIYPSHGTPFQTDADGIFKAVQTKYLAGEYPDAQTALNDAAAQIEQATGLPVAK